MEALMKKNIILLFCLTLSIFLPHSSPAKAEGRALYNQYHQMIMDSKGKIMVDPKLAYDVLLQMGWNPEQASYFLLSLTPKERVTYTSNVRSYGPKVKRKPSK